MSQSCHVKTAAAAHATQRVVLRRATAVDVAVWRVETPIHVSAHDLGFLPRDASAAYGAFTHTHTHTLEWDGLHW